MENKIFLREQEMALPFSAGIDWCHDFPKLAKESGFHFKMHRSHVLFDWNQINTIDIDRIIRERDFSTIDNSISSVVDYHVEKECDTKIFDPNFMKLFRLAQLSVEYLLYCKQYLDHSVIILKDELQTKVEENVKLKRELSTFVDNMQQMRGKFRNKYKLIEKRVSDSHGEIYKCPFCPKTFMADVFMNAHITRRHSNALYLPMVSPIHEQYKAQTEKLQDEIKALKERLNETERVVRNDPFKICHDEGLSQDEYSDLKIDGVEKNTSIRDRRLEEEHERYRTEVNRLKTMLFSEIRRLQQNEKQSVKHNKLEDENMRELLKQQEKDINQIRDQLQHLSLNKSTPDMEVIKAKLNAQENYWRTELGFLQSQHHHDIEALYRQLKIIRTSTDYMEPDYSNRIMKSKTSSNNRTKLVVEKPSVEIFGRSQSRSVKPDQTEAAMNNGGICEDNGMTAGANDDNCAEILIEDLDKISEIHTIATQPLVNELDHLNVMKVNSDDDPARIRMKRDNIRKNIHTLKPRRDSLRKLSVRLNKINVDHPLVSLNITPNETSPHQNGNAVNHVNTVSIARQLDEIDAYPSESNGHDWQSESTLNSGNAESERTSRLEQVNRTNSCERKKTQDSEHSQTNEGLKNEEELKIEIQEALEQKLRDLGVDPQWQQIPNATYRQLNQTVKYHRTINSKKYHEFNSLRQDIIKQIANCVSKYDVDYDISNVQGTGNPMTKVKVPIMRHFPHS